MFVDENAELSLQVVSNYAEQRLISRGSTGQSSSESFIVGFILDSSRPKSEGTSKSMSTPYQRDCSFAYLSA